MTTTLKIKRPNGGIEIVDVTEKLGRLPQHIYDRIKKQTAEAGRGEVIECVMTTEKSNMPELRKQYNDLHNEGGEGYIPEAGYFQSLPEYKTWVVTEIVN